MKIRFYDSEYIFEVTEEDNVDLIENTWLISDLTPDNHLYGLLEVYSQGRFSCLFQEIDFTHIQISK